MKGAEDSEWKRFLTRVSGLEIRISAVERLAKDSRQGAMNEWLRWRQTYIVQCDTGLADDTAFLW